MSKLRGDLERLMAGIDPPSGSYDQFVLYRGRKLRRRKAIAAAVGLLLATGGLLIVLRSFNSPRNEPATPVPEVGNGLIVFASSQEGAYDLYAMEPDGTNPANLTNTPDVSETEPAWSADGSRIAFVRCLDCTTTDVFLMKADGSGISAVTNDLAYDGGPAWSPDGSLIAYHSDPNPVSPTPEDIAPVLNEDIYVINPDGSERRRLTDEPARELNPAWSPDGMRIAFLAIEGTEPSSMSSSIYVMNSDGSDRTRLTDSSIWAFGSPTWSPDGSRIAFVVLDQEDKSTDIYIMNADGRAVTKLTTDGAAGFPTWAPDGSKIAYATYSGGVYLLALDGSLSRIYTPQSGFMDDRPAWQPVWTPGPAS